MDIYFSGLFGLLGTFTGAWVTLHTTKYFDDRERFNNAYEAFRQSFSTAIQELSRKDLHRVEIMVNEFPKHVESFFNFSTHLGVKIPKRLTPKWEEYKNYYTRYYDEHKRQNLEMIDFLLKEDDKTERQKISSLIYEILEIAKDK